jgi:hypothetical protein
MQVPIVKGSNIAGIGIDRVQEQVRHHATCFTGPQRHLRLFNSDLSSNSMTMTAMMKMIHACQPLSVTDRAIACRLAQSTIRQVLYVELEQERKQSRMQAGELLLLRQRLQQAEEALSKRSFQSTTTSTSSSTSTSTSTSSTSTLVSPREDVLHRVMKLSATEQALKQAMVLQVWQEYVIENVVQLKTHVCLGCLLFQWLH